MWTEDTMSVLQSLVVSGLGMVVVFIALIALAVAIIVVSKLLALAGIKPPERKTEVPAVSAVKSSNVDDEVLAVIVPVISEEMHKPIDSFRIKEIREI